jgi:hypothetical protein
MATIQFQFRNLYDRFAQNNGKFYRSHVPWLHYNVCHFTLKFRLAVTLAHIIAIEIEYLKELKLKSTRYTDY